jgi:tetratricopeptide (TPR) repeat protein
VSAFDSKAQNHPLIYSYLKRYQEDPSSRVFAPLAEAYRKVGLIDEAIEIAREGLKVHPSFVGGRVALARALFDKHLYEEVVEELQQIIRDVPDNLVAQRLLAESSLMLGRVADALGAYKMLLYFAPQDPEVVKIVQELEAQAYEKGALVLSTDPKPVENAYDYRPDYGPDDKDSETNFSMADTGQAINEDPDVKRKRWVHGIEILQGLLQKVERYKTLNSIRK